MPPMAMLVCRVSGAVTTPHEEFAALGKRELWRTAIVAEPFTQKLTQTEYHLDSLAQVTLTHYAPNEVRYRTNNSAPWAGSIFRNLLPTRLARHYRWPAHPHTPSKLPAPSPASTQWHPQYCIPLCTQERVAYRASSLHRLSTTAGGSTRAIGPLPIQAQTPCTTYTLTKYLHQLLPTS